MMTSVNEKNGTGDCSDHQQQQEESSGETQSKEQGQTDTNNTNENDQKEKDDDGDAELAAKRQRRTNKIQRMVRILLVVPYMAGIVWTCLHPMVSVITGELKCRGWFLDEHSIETRFTAGQNPRVVPVHLADNVDVTPLRSRSNTDNDNDNDASAPYSLCDFFDREGDPGFNERNRNLICHEHGDHFDMAMILPLSNAIDASEEAVVLVVPRPSDVYQGAGTTLDWNSSIFHQAMIRSIWHLADPVETPWLAKAVLVVTPTMNSNPQSLDQTVSAFLDAYLGQQTISRDYQTKRQEKSNSNDETTTTVPQLPPMLSGAILRNLVVLEVFDESSSMANRSTNNNNRNNAAVGSTDLSILPQGRRGVLPNADLVFLVGKLMDKTQFYLHAHTKTFLTHPYTQDSKQAESWINRWIDIGSETFLASSSKEWTTKAKTWAKGLIDVSLFAKTLAVGPYPPHASALERGIDSLTVRASFEGTFRRDPSVELVQHAEYIVRSLANLSERLHHSFTLYLLPTPKAFVAHIEYLLPNVLVLLPLVVRVFGILLPSMKRGLDLTALGGVLLTVLSVVVAMFLAALITDGNDEATMAAVFVLLYTGVAVFWIRNILLRNHHNQQCQSQSGELPKDLSCQQTEPNEGSEDEDQDSNPETTRTILTLQFATCALVVYILVPIAFAHASLSYLPSVLWTPLLAFPNYPSMKNSNAPSGSGSGFQRLVVVPVLCLLVVATAPPLVLVPGVFSAYTPFVRYVYTPIHSLFFLLVTSIVVS